MYRSVILLFIFTFFSIFSVAEERNPFLPYGYKVKPKNSKMVNEEFDFPANTARVMRVLIQYKNKDGSTSYKTLVIDKKIDSSKKLLLKQGEERDSDISIIDPKRVKIDKKLTPEKLTDTTLDADNFGNVGEEVKVIDTKKKVVKKSSFVLKPKREKSFEEKVIESNFKNVRVMKPKTENQNNKIAKITKNEYIKNIKVYKFLSIALYKNKFFIQSEDKVKQDFELAKSKKIVIDFKRSTKEKFKSFSINKTPYKSIVIGVHKNYYRVVIKLTKYKKYRIKHLENGYIISLR